MQLLTDGLIIRETPVGEADKFITILTRERGLLRAAARGSRRVNSRSAAATQLLTHASLSLKQGKNQWYVDDARPLHVFFALHDDLEKLALAQYFCELAGTLCPREEPAADSLRLLLNALHFLSTGTRSATLVKAIVEGRLLAEAGYAPDLSVCCRCGRVNGPFFLLPVEGRLVCADCQSGRLPLGDDAVAAMRRLIGGTLEQSFSLALSPPTGDAVAAAMEAFLLAQLGRGFATLDFYHTLHNT